METKGETWQGAGAGLGFKKEDAYVIPVNTDEGAWGGTYDDDLDIGGETDAMLGDSSWRVDGVNLLGGARRRVDSQLVGGITEFMQKEKQKSPGDMDAKKDKDKEWTTGWTDCCAAKGIAIKGCLAPCCLGADTSHSLLKHDWCYSCLCYLVFSPCWGAHIRSDITRHYQMNRTPGFCGIDWSGVALHSCCCWCATCQEARHYKKRYEEETSLYKTDDGLKGGGVEAVKMK